MRERNNSKIIKRDNLQQNKVIKQQLKNRKDKFLTNRDKKKKKIGNK